MKQNFFINVKQATVILGLCAISFVLLEPAISSAVEDQFTVTQVITSEISFLTPSSDVTLSPTIAGITGGTSNGGTQLVVLTNNATGYSMFVTASSSAGMIGIANGGTIAAFSSTTIPTFNFNSDILPANTAAFAFTAEASTSLDLVQGFRDNNTGVCGTGSLDTVDSCWQNATTGPNMIVNRSSATAASGATTTMKFRVVVRANPSPAIPADTYVATTTLTATVNP